MPQGLKPIVIVVLVAGTEVPVYQSRLS